MPIGPSPLPPMSKEEKGEEERIRNNLKRRASLDRKKAKEIIERKRDLEGHIIKPTQNAFDMLSRVRDGSATFHDNLALTNNYSRERTRKRKISTEFHDSTTSLSVPIKRKRKNWFHLGHLRWRWRWRWRAYHINKPV